MALVSVIIPTYNRFRYMLNAVNSVLAQTHTLLEIIVVNDSSTDENYYTHDFSDERVRFIHLATAESSRAVCGFPCAGYVRTIGMKAAAGDYFAFLDDDDCWLPHKLETQLAAMAETGAAASCTEGYVGRGPMVAGEKYPCYNSEMLFAGLDAIYRGKLSARGFPRLWDADFLSVHNCVICSSVLVGAEAMRQNNYMRYLRGGEEDYRCWIDLLDTGVDNFVYVREPCVYYDMGHGDGRLY